MFLKISFTCLILISLFNFLTAYLIGRGIADITGPSTGILFHIL